MENAVGHSNGVNVVKKVKVTEADDVFANKSVGGEGKGTEHAYSGQGGTLSVEDKVRLVDVAKEVFRFSGRYSTG